MSSRRRGPGARSLGDLDLFEDPNAGQPVRSPHAPRNPESGIRHPSVAVPVEETIPGGSPASAVGVSVLTQTARDVLEGAFMPLWVRGEVTDFKSHRNGHWYFCLRDAEAQIRCVVWSRDRRGIPAPPDDGMQVVALGQLTVFPGRGEMQLSVKRMEAEGDGLWRKALERTRARLAADGLLAPERKRALPRYPRRIAVVTSPDGAAVRDIIAVARRRSPGIEIIVISARVQGEGAPDELCSALARVARWRGADAVIIGRGGGGRDDLWALNDERVARAVADCPMPTISAIGHEIDITICDLVADVRAATPSAAAEALVPLREELVAELRMFGGALREGATDAVVRRRDQLRDAAQTVCRVAARRTERDRATVSAAAGRLHALSPLATLARGYAVARMADGTPLTSAMTFSAGLEFELRLHDGSVRATTDAVHHDSNATPSAHGPRP